MFEKNKENQVRMWSVLVISLVFIVLIALASSNNKGKNSSFEPKSLSEISQGLKGKTTLQEQKLIRDIVGKDIRTEATVVDVEEISEKIKITTEEGIVILVHNNTENSKKLLNYNKMDIIKFNGKIKKVLDNKYTEDDNDQYPVFVEITNILKK